MRVFLAENWDKWEEEQPEWFTQSYKDKVDDDVLPAEELRKQILAGGGSRRRDSVLDELMRGSARRGSDDVARVGIEET